MDLDRETHPLRRQARREDCDAEDDERTAREKRTRVMLRGGWNGDRILKELDAERAVSKALAAVLQREVDWAARATSPSARMPEYENARAALAQYAATQPEAKE